MKLLVSVRDESEARIVNDHADVSIIDMKEPFDGSLGSVSFQTALVSRQTIQNQRVTSIALGEVLDPQIWLGVTEADRRALLSKFDYAKFGLSGLSAHKDWISQWHAAFAKVPESVQRVAVGYADEERAKAPLLEAILESSPEVNARVFLLDTFSKQHGNLFQIVGLPRLKRLVHTARQQNLMIGIAGSMGVRDLRTAIELNPDFIAVRGAVCVGDRTSSIDSHQLNKFIEQMESLRNATTEGSALNAESSHGEIQTKTAR